MSIIDFNHLKITTMTVVMPMKGSINLDMVFPLLEITRLDLPVPKRQSHKYKIPYCGIPGAVLSARYCGHTRGIIKSKAKSFFRNSITIDMSTSEKNVNLKLSRNKIQMCGATSVQLSQEAGNLIIANLYNIQDNIDYINEHPQEAEIVIKWLKDVIKGPQMELPAGYINEEQITPIRVHSMRIPEEIPEMINRRIALFFLYQAPDFLIYEDYCSQIDWVRTLTTVITRPLEVMEIQKVMVNYNYDLGFHVNRWALYQNINGYNGFKARYENSVDHSVTIELPYEVPAHMKITRRRDKVPCHIFIVYKSGLVTQSGPNEELMREAYNRFNSTINELRPLIMKPGMTRRLKYVSCYKAATTSTSSEDQSTSTSKESPSTECSLGDSSLGDSSIGDGSIGDGSIGDGSAGRGEESQE